MSIENILAFINNNKMSLLLTVLTSLPAVYFIIHGLLEKPYTSGGAKFPGLILVNLIFCIIAIPLCGWLVFYIFGLSIKWLSILLIFIAPIMYFICVFIAGGIALAIWFLIIILLGILT